MADVRPIDANALMDGKENDDARNIIPWQAD